MYLKATGNFLYSTFSLLFRPIPSTAKNALCAFTHLLDFSDCMKLMTIAFHLCTNHSIINTTIPLFHIACNLSYMNFQSHNYMIVFSREQFFLIESGRIIYHKITTSFPDRLHSYIPVPDR